MTSWSKQSWSAKLFPKRMSECCAVGLRLYYLNNLTYNPFRLQLLSAVTYMGSFGTYWSCLRRVGLFPNNDTYSWGTTLIGDTTQSRRFCCFFSTSSNILKQLYCWEATISQGTSQRSMASMTKSLKNMGITMFGTISLILSTTYPLLLSLKERSFVFTGDFRPKERPLIRFEPLSVTLKYLHQDRFATWCGQTQKMTLKTGSPAREWLVGSSAAE